jgi:hypothetical protein
MFVISVTGVCQDNYGGDIVFLHILLELMERYIIIIIY